MGRLLHYALLHRPEGGSRARRDVDLVVDVLNVVVGSLGGDNQSIGDGLGGETSRGKPTAVVVATGSDPGNIHLAIALKRACNHGARWPIPIFMRETSQSEFSQQYAHGDDTPELDAYLQAFGAHQMQLRASARFPNAHEHVKTVSSPVERVRLQQT